MVTFCWENFRKWYTWNSIESGSVQLYWSSHSIAFKSLHLDVGNPFNKGRKWQCSRQWLIVYSGDSTLSIFPLSLSKHEDPNEEFRFFRKDWTDWNRQSNLSPRLFLIQALAASLSLSESVQCYSYWCTYPPENFTFVIHLFFLTVSVVSEHGNLSSSWVRAQQVLASIDSLFIPGELIPLHNVRVLEQKKRSWRQHWIQPQVTVKFWFKGIVFCVCTCSPIWWSEIIDGRRKCWTSQSSHLTPKLH